MSINVPLIVPTDLADVGAPTVTPQGAGGSDTWDYAIVGVTASGKRSQVSTNGTTAAGSATLNDTDLNRVTWTDVAGYVLYEVWRQVTADAVTAPVGLIGRVIPGGQTFDDVGQHGEGGTPSATNEAGEGAAQSLAAFTGSVEALLENVGVGTYEIQTSQDAAAWTIEGVALTADGARTLAADKRFVRVINTAFTSGTPRAFAAGSMR